MAALESADPRARCFVGLCLYCGLRREEALGLQWSDIQGDKLTVNRAVTFLNNQPDPIQELKSKSAHRTLPVPQRLLDLLAVVPRTSLYVVTCADGEVMTRIGFRRMWDKVKRASPCEVRPHQLRHPYVKPKTTNSNKFFTDFPHQRQNRLLSRLFQHSAPDRRTPSQSEHPPAQNSDYPYPPPFAPTLCWLFSFFRLSAAGLV